MLVEVVTPFGRKSKVRVAKNRKCYMLACKFNMYSFLFCPSESICLFFAFFFIY